MSKGKRRVTSEHIDGVLKELADTTSGELTLAEIAEACGTNKQCIQQIEVRALRRFRQELEPIYEEWYNRKPYIN